MSRFRVRELKAGDELDRLDIAKSLFQVRGVDATGDVVIRQRLGRSKVLRFFARIPPLLVGLEACERHTIGAENCGGLATMPA